MNVINYGSDGVEESQIAQRLRLAQALQAQSMEERPLYSNRAALAKVLMGALGGMQTQSAEKEQRELAGRKEAGRKAEIDAIFSQVEGPQGLPPGAVQKDDDGNAMPGTESNPRMSLARMLAGSSNPGLAQAGLGMALKGPEKAEAYTLKPGERRYEGGKVVAEVPEHIKPEGPKKGEVRKLDMGGDVVTQEFDGSAWKELARGSRWQPQQEDRSLVEVQDPQNPQRTVMVPRSQALGKAGAQSVTSARASREDVDSLRKEFNGLDAVKNFSSVRPIVESARKAPDTPQGDFALIYGVGKVLDPGSVVREGEMNLVIKAGSPAQRVESYLRSLQGKGRLSPDMRKELQVILDQRAGEYEKGYQSARSTYEGIAKQRGHDSSQIFTALPGSGPVKVSSDADYAALPSGAVFIDPNGKQRRKP